MYVTCENDIREWILDGQPRKERTAGVPSAKQYLVPMPAYRELLNADQLNDLVAYFNRRGLDLELAHRGQHDQRGREEQRHR